MPPATQRLFEWDVIDKTYFRISGESKGLLAGRPDMPPLGGDIDPYQGDFLSDLFADIGSTLFSGRPDSYRRALIYDGRLDGNDVRVARLVLSDKVFGEPVVVEVAETTRKRQALAEAIALSTVIPQLLLILVAGMAIHRAIGHGLTPLNLISERLEARSHQDLSPILYEGVPTEVRPMTLSLNNLLGRLADAQTAQRRFIADAAHQLRTPLTALKLQVEEATREDTLEGARAILTSLRASADRAVRLSNQLLSLARAEPGGSQSKPFQQVNLVSLMQETGAEWAPRALSTGIDIQFESEPDAAAIAIMGDADLLREAIGNLLDNAVKYHKAPGTIRMRVLANPAPTIIVEDDGPGIPFCPPRSDVGAVCAGGAR